MQVLVQSFMWAEKLKDEGARAEAQAAADRFISAMSAEPEVSLEHLYSARQGVPNVILSVFCQLYLARHQERCHLTCTVCPLHMLNPCAG